MSQHSYAINEQRQYTRVDFTALRAYLCKIETATILRLYYYEDDLEARKISGTSGLARFLEDMRDDLIARLNDSDIAFAEVNTMDDLSKHPHLRRIEVDLLDIAETHAFTTRIDALAGHVVQAQHHIL